LVDLQRMAYPRKWSPISYKSSAGQRKDTGQRPMLYRWTNTRTAQDRDVINNAVMPVVILCSEDTQRALHFHVLHFHAPEFRWSVIFMPCDLVRHFQIVHFQSTRKNVAAKCLCRRWSVRQSPMVSVSPRMKTAVVPFVHTKVDISGASNVSTVQCVNVNQ